MRQLCADYQAELSEQKLKQKVQLKSSSLVTTQPNKCHKRLNFNSTQQQRPKKKLPVAASDEMWNKEITQFLKS